MLYRFLLVVCVLATVPLSADQPIQIYQDQGKRAPKQPQAFVTAAGLVHLTFGAADKIYYCSGRTGHFDTPSPVFEVPNLALGMRRGPRIAATKQAIVITAIGGEIGKGKDGDVLAYRSFDAGKSWLGPTRVNDVVASAREGLHAMSISSAGTLWCVWLDLRSEHTELYAAKSADDGQTWSKNQLIYRSPGGNVCECCHPSVVCFGQSIHVLFRNSLAGNRDMYLISSSDNGNSFGPAKRLGLASWQLDACPMDGGMLTVTSTGEVATAWRRKGIICTANLTNNQETVVADGEQPWLAATAAATFVTWTTSREGELMLSELGTGKSSKIAAGARDPVVVANSGTDDVHLFWEQKVGDKTSIMWHSPQ